MELGVERDVDVLKGVEPISAWKYEQWKCIHESFSRPCPLLSPIERLRR